MTRLLLGLALLACGTASAQQRQNVILYIGDGFGTSPKTATRMALGQGQDGARFSTDPNFHLLELDKLPFTGSITTHSLNSWVTDSAPGAAVYASGQPGKVDNEFITLDPVSKDPIETILEQAKKAGYAVGLVSTARITHATPAAFASHLWNRNLEDYIAAQFVTTTQGDYETLLSSGRVTTGTPRTYNADRDWVLPTPKRGVQLDVMLGGGARFFLPNARTNTTCQPSANAAIVDRTGAAIPDPNGATALTLVGRRADCVDVVQFARDRGAQYVNSRDALLNIDMSQFTPESNATLLGLFHESHVSYEQERQSFNPYEPSLEEMTRMAIEVLERKSPKGFFLMVESGRIDHMEHANAGGVYTRDGKLVIEANQESPRADDIYGAPNPSRIPGVFGSDFMIKEVMQFDYAVGVGRDLAADASKGNTLIFSTSDHECGGFAAVSLNDAASANTDNTSRTYAQEPRRGSNTAADFLPPPTNITRGPAWFPDYTMVDFQGKAYPQVAPDGHRIVIAYGSNPVTNGNGGALQSTPGNHTPMDIWIGAEDNVGGSFARRITGRGLLDNTDLYPIMTDFLQVRGTVSAETEPVSEAFGLSVARPNPTAGRTAFTLTLDRAQPVTVEVVDALGRRVALVQEQTDMTAGEHTVSWDGTAAPGLYFVRATAGGRTLTRPTTVVR